MVRYKVGKFQYPVFVTPGDIINLSLKEELPDGTSREQTVSEDIQITKEVSHWVMFYAPGIGFGGMFGGPDIEARLPEVFVNPVRVSEEEFLIQ